MTLREKLEAINAEISDLFDFDTLIGKQAVLTQVIMHMDYDKAMKFLDDTFDILQDEVEYCYDAMDLNDDEDHGDYYDLEKAMVINENYFEEERGN